MLIQLLLLLLPYANSSRRVRECLERSWTWLQTATNRLPQSGAYAIKLERESQKTATVDRDYLSRDYLVDQHTQILPERLLPVNPKRRTSHSLPLPGPV